MKASLSLLSSAALLLFSANSPADFVNEPAVPQQLISKSHPELGRLTTIEVLGDYIIAIPEVPSSTPEGDFIVRALDISDPENPVTVATFGRTAHPVCAHGTYKKYNYVYLNGGIVDGVRRNAVRLEEDGSLTHTTWPWGINDFCKASVSYPWAATSFWTYNDPSGFAQLELYDDTVATWDHLGTTGVVGFPTIIGNILLYGSDQSKSGVAAYDISNPANPVLLDVLKLPELHPTITRSRFVDGSPVDFPVEGGLGGYFYEISGHYMVFARRLENPGVQVVDFSDPTNLRVHCEVFFRDPERNLEMDSALNPMYPNFQDEYIFAERLKINIDTCEVEGVLNEVESQVETSQYLRPIGNLLLTGGGHNHLIEEQGVPSGGLGIWGHQAEPDTRPPYVSYHIPRPDQTNYPVTAPVTLLIPETLHATTILPGDTLLVTEGDGDVVEVDYTLSHSGMLTVFPEAREWEPGTTYRVHLEGIEDAVHNRMEPYTFFFSTGESLNESFPSIDDIALSPSNTLLIDESVTVTVDASDADGDTLEYRFRRDSGEEYGPWTNSNVATFTYSELGSYAINVQVRDGRGGTVANVVNVAVVDILYSSEPSLNSKQLALSADGEFIWVVNPDNSSLAQVSVTTNELIAEFRAGTTPSSVAIDGSGLAWVTAYGDDAVYLINNLGARVVTIDLEYGDGPHGIVMNRDGSMAYVSLYNSGKVIKIDVASRTVIAELDGLSTPKTLALTEAGDRLLVTRFISGENWAEVYDIATENLSLSRTFQLGENLEEDDLDNGRGVFNYLAGLVIDANDQYAYVAGKKDNTARGLINNTIDLDDDNTTRTFLTKLDLNRNREIRSERLDFDNGDSPSSLAIASNGQYLFASLQGSNQVEVLSRDLRDGSLGAFVSSINTGLAPQGMLIDAATEKMFVKNYTERSISAVDVSGLLVGNVVNPAITTIGTVSSERLRPQVLRGKQIFYNAVFGQTEDSLFARMSAEGYLSCATCHIDGGQDGRTFDFTGRGEGLRNNISLKGRSGTRFGNVLWSANFDEIHDFENDIRLRFLGSGLMDDSDFESTQAPLGAPKAGASAELDALAAYVSSLGKSSLPRSPHRDPDGLLTTEGLLGQQVFDDLGCNDCHRGAAFTDGVVHDVGTLREYSGRSATQSLAGVKTPSLLGLFETAPYLHDGSAATLEDVFSILGGQVIQAESLELGEGAQLVRAEDFSYMRGGAGVRLSDGFSVDLTLPATAHSGSIRVRYGSVTTPTRMLLTINGTQYARDLELLPQVEGQDVAFLDAVFSVDLADSNEVSVSIEATLNGSVIVDDITVSSATEAELAQGHRAFLSASATDKDNLIRYLLQIDQNSAPNDQDEIVLGVVEQPQEEEPSTGGGTPDEDVDDPSQADGPTSEEEVDQGGGVDNSDDDSGAGHNGPMLLLLALMLLLTRYRKVASVVRR